MTLARIIGSLIGVGLVFAIWYTVAKKKKNEKAMQAAVYVCIPVFFASILGPLIGLICAAAGDFAYYYYCKSKSGNKDSEGHNDQSNISTITVQEFDRNNSVESRKRRIKESTMEDLSRIASVFHATDVFERKKSDIESSVMEILGTYSALHGETQFYGDESLVARKRAAKKCVNAGLAHIFDIFELTDDKHLAIEAMGSAYDDELKKDDSIVFDESYDNIKACFRRYAKHYIDLKGTDTDIDHENT